MQRSEDITQIQDKRPWPSNQASQPFFELKTIEMPALINAPSIGQASEWVGPMQRQGPTTSKMGFLSYQEQLDHQTLFHRYNYFMDYHSQALGRIKMDYCKGQLRPQDIGKYLTNLMVSESNSDFFFDVYVELQKVRHMVETYVSDYFIRQRFERVRARDKEILLKAPEDKAGLVLGFAGYSEIEYRRMVDKQTRISDSILSELHSFTFKFLELDESVYMARLNQEMVLWDHHQELKKSPHIFLRKQAGFVESQFIKTHQKLLEFKKQQRYTKDAKEITLKQLRHYLQRLGELKGQALKAVSKPCEGCQSSGLASAFDFLEGGGRPDCSKGEHYHSTDVKAIMIFDQLCQETELRPDQVSLKLEEIGHKVSVSELLTFNLFV